MMPNALKTIEIFNLYNNIRKDYHQLRKKWINHIKTNNHSLSEKQKDHLDSHSKNVNFALRFVDTLTVNDAFWNKSFKEQNTMLLEKA